MINPVSALEKFEIFEFAHQHEEKMPTGGAGSDSFTSPSKRKRVTFEAASGPSPGSSASLKAIPNTMDRIVKRSRRMHSLCAEAHKSEFEMVKEQLENNKQIATLLKTGELEKRMGALDPALQKKCYTIAQLVIFQMGEENLEPIGEELLDETFWSSGKALEAEGVKCVGVSTEDIRSSIGKAKPTPMLDHHSERACVMWIAEKVHEVCDRILAKAGLEKSKITWTDKVIHLNMVTKFSSCRACIKVLGEDHNFFRISELMSSRVCAAYGIPLAGGPSASILHQGMQHFHHETKMKTKELPEAEFYCSRSLIGVSPLEFVLGEL